MKKYSLLVILLISSIFINTKAQNCNISYDVLGKGEPIIIIHGGPGLDHNYLFPYIKPLSRKYKLVFYDQRGSGVSESIVDTTTLNPTTFIDDLDWLIKKLGFEKVILLGHSWGSLLAIKYASLHPGKIKALLLTGTVGITPDYLKDMNANILFRRSKEDSSKIVLIRSSKEFAEGNRASVEDFIDTYFHSYFYDLKAGRDFKVNIDEPTAKNFLKIYSLMTKYLLTMNLTEDSKRINVPTLIINGAYDPIPVKYGEELHSLIKNSKFVVLKNSGHFPFVESNENFIKECERFLIGK